MRNASDRAYRDYIVNALPRHESLGGQISKQLLYYPTVSREDFAVDGHDRRGRLTTLLDSGRIAADLGLDPLDAGHDRAMICGGPQMLADFRSLLDARGFTAAPRIGVDRKSVVSGKRGSLRVDIGGCRNIKKKKEIKK